LRTREWAAGIRFRGARRPSGGASTAGRGGGHGAGAGVAPASRVTVGKTAERKEIRSDRLGPHGSERRRKVGNSWAGCLCWAARIGGLAVCANQRRASGCWRELSKLRCGPRCTGSFPNFSNLSSYLN
jgi:hypothetical protein